MSGDDHKIATLRTNRKPYEFLSTEHLRCCAEDVAQLVTVANSKDTSPDFFLTYARQLARVRREAGRILPADYTLLTGDLHPYTLAGITSPKEFADKCAIISAARAVSLETNSGQSIVRQTILQNTNYALLQICGYIMPSPGNPIMAHYARLDGAMELCMEKAGLMIVDEGVVLHERINRALKRLGLETYPDIVPPSRGAQRPEGPPKLKLI